MKPYLMLTRKKDLGILTRFSWNIGRLFSDDTNSYFVHFDAGYRFSKLFALGLGWTMIDFEFDKEYDYKNLDVGVQLGGPTLTFRFNFWKKRIFDKTKVVGSFNIITWLFHTKQLKDEWSRIELNWKPVIVCHNYRFCLIQIIEIF